MYKKFLKTATILFITASMSVSIFGQPENNKKKHAIQNEGNVNLLPNGNAFSSWDCKTSFTKTYFVAQKNPGASDANPGTESLPFLTVGKAAAILQPGERVIICEGIYREFVRPVYGGTGTDKMISYEALPGAKVIIDGTEVWATNWEPSKGLSVGDSVDMKARVWHGELPRKAFDGINPFAMVNMPNNHWGGLITKIPNKTYQLRRGLLFVDGLPLEQVFLHKDLWTKPGTYWIEDDGLNIHFRLKNDDAPASHVLEFTARDQVFSPAVPYTAYIRVKGIRFEKVGNGFPGEQRGALSTNCGNHWIIEDNQIHWANSIGIDVGNVNFQNYGEQAAGSHIIRRNIITDCGTTGLCGLVVGWHLYNTLIEDNMFEDNCWQNTEMLGENAAIKMHMAINCLIRHNIIRNTLHGVGIWLDYDNSNTRVCNNVIFDIEETINGGIFFEASLNKNLIDGNVVWGVKSAGIADNEGGGHGIYERNCDSLTIMNNFIWSAAGTAVCLDRGDRERFVLGRIITGRKHTVTSNILANCGKAILLPSPDNYSDKNIFGSFTNQGPFIIQEPAERCNLGAWQDFYNWELHGKAIVIKSKLNEESLMLKIQLIDGIKMKEKTINLKADFSIKQFVDECKD
ncbi:MAG: right-handed parallel beta-helix repeat-containing protein [Ferruginibacter sp.]|nr:right-handed parallel beta-helix repeat-containing protein [Ferruginibacter sp.]